MKVTNFAVINMINTLEKFAGKKLPQKISYAITRNLFFLQKDYECYIKSLNKIFSEYDEYIVKDEEKNFMVNDLGLPIIDSKVEKEFNDDIANLLNIEIEINFYNIPENVFDYEDGLNRYDSLSAEDIINLQSVLCDMKGGD